MSHSKNSNGDSPAKLHPNITSRNRTIVGVVSDLTPIWVKEIFGSGNPLSHPSIASQHPHITIRDKQTSGNGNYSLMESQGTLVESNSPTESSKYISPLHPLSLAQIFDPKAPVAAASEEATPPNITKRSKKMQAVSGQNLGEGLLGTPVDGPDYDAALSGTPVNINLENEFQSRGIEKKATIVTAPNIEKIDRNINKETEKEEGSTQSSWVNCINKCLGRNIGR